MSPKIATSSLPNQSDIHPSPNKSNSTDDNEQLLSSTAKGASYLILLQLVSRMLTFILHQVVLRYTTAETFGIASVKLELLLSTILFISREGYRCALVRGGDSPPPIPTDSDSNKHKSSAESTIRTGSATLRDNTPDGQEQKITNISYIPTALGLLTTCLACGYYLHTIDETVATIYPYYRSSVILFGAAAMIELCVEPLFIMALNRMYFQLRVSVEGVAVVLRCLITFSLTLWGASQQNGDDGSNNMYGILAFAVAQFAYGLVIAFGYAAYFLYKVRSKEMNLSNLFPQKLSSSDGRKYWFDPALTTLGSTLTKQSLLKHVLTEGDKMLISALSSDGDQGVYAFVVNYGCLVVRILFQPLEETGRTLFSKLLNRTGSINEKGAQETNRMAMDILMLIIRFHVILGLIFICFGTNYTATLIDLLVGKKWSQGEGNAPLVLSFYCMYVPIMGINGITEGFVQAVASKSDLAKLSYYMVGFSLCFMGAGVFFMAALQLGAIGLVLANMVNLGIRITYSWYYIVKFFQSRGTSTTQLTLSSWLPSYITLAAFASSWLVTFLSEQWIGWQSFQQKLLHIGIGGTCFVLVCLVMIWKERSFIRGIQQLSKTKRS